MSENILSIRDLHVHYKKDRCIVRAVNGLSLDIERGTTLGLVGETGAGKTTTAKSIMRLIPDPPGEIVGGQIIFDGRDVLAMSAAEMRRMRGRDAAMIFQDPMTSLNPVMTVGEQIEEMILLHDEGSRADASVRAMEMLELVGISRERFSDYPHQFSGGMKQRVVIAIALACEPKLLIADEPTTALDVTIQAQVLELMSDLKEKFDTSMLLITHDLGVVAQVCDRVAVMYAGEVVEQGDLDDIYGRAAHPYTIGLFGSIPDLDKETKRLSPIAGLMPDPTALPAGCSFGPRCPRYCERCDQDPPAVETSPGHFVKCWFAGGGE